MDHVESLRLGEDYCFPTKNAGKALTVFEQLTGTFKATVAARWRVDGKRTTKGTDEPVDAGFTSTPVRCNCHSMRVG